MTHTTLVDCATLVAHLDDPVWVLFDCRFDLADTGRGRRAYQQSHLPGARYARFVSLASPNTWLVAFIDNIVEVTRMAV